MIELLTNAQMAEADRLTIAGGTSGIELMETAGRAVAERVLLRPGSRVVVVAGPGNNGGDGFVAARVAAQAGRAVRLLLLGEADRLKGDAALAAQRFDGPVEPARPEALAEADIIVDALFGAGLERPLVGQAAAMVEAMNAGAGPIVAVDLPSGINGSSGRVLGVAVRAAETVTFFRRKVGHVLLPGRLHCGVVHVADIGIPASVLSSVGPNTFLNCPALWGGTFPLPRVEGHKYSRGHAVVVSGGLAHTGAARLAARGALRAGAGLATIASPSDALAVNAAANLAVMVRPVDGAEALAALLEDQRLNAVVIGPGGGVGPQMRALVHAALCAPAAVVLDADALTSFADAPADLFAATTGRPAPVVMTPHDGEFSRLFKFLPEVTEMASKIDRTRLAAKASGGVVLLKGPDTVVASPDGRAVVAENAPPWLATAGAGDVLAGFIAGLLAQHTPPFEAASAAAWVHGEAGAHAGPGLIAEDLPEALPKVYRALFENLSV